MPFDPQLADQMRDALRDRESIEERKMFGGICWMQHGNMLCGVGVGRFLFRVGKERQAAAVERPGATAAEMAGRPMHGYVWVGSQHAEGESLREWIDFAAGYVGSLPRK